MRETFNVMKRTKGSVLLISIAVLIFLLAAAFGTKTGALFAFASEDESSTVSDDTDLAKSGGGYAVTGQIEGVGYTTRLFNATNGLPTSDANCILATSDGYIWIGGYSGIIRYDGNVFERLDSSGGLTNGRAVFEDSLHRIWIGTNDNGVVMLDGDQHHYTYKEGLPSSCIRAFAESNDGTIYIGTTNGVCYMGHDGVLHNMEDSQIRNSYVLRLVSDTNGNIYGCIKSGATFRIKNRKLDSFYYGHDLGIGEVKSILVDPDNERMVYLGTDKGTVFHGSFEDKLKTLKNIPLDAIGAIQELRYASGRIWAIADGFVGYFDEKRAFHLLKDLPLNSGMETMTEDYQGNLWFTSSRQGVLEIVSNNFQNITEMAKLPDEVANSTCMYKDNLYIGTDKGLQIVNSQNERITNSISDNLGDTRIRCIMRDDKNNLWISTYSNDRGLVCFKDDEEIITFNEDNGFINNGVRCTKLLKDGTILAGTNGGLAFIKDMSVVRTVGEKSGMRNTIVLTVEEGNDGKIYCGSDGDGIYVIDDNNVTRLGRDEGLTSDVILRIKKDVKRDVLWIVTSNSIEFMKDGEITPVNNFPYTNNYDIYFDDNENMWILASYGIYCVKAQDLLDNESFEYKLYDTANGLPSVPTGNAFSELDDNKNLYVAGRSAVSKVNINNFYEQANEIIVGVKAIFCGDEYIAPGINGEYVIPADAGRIQINAAILNYTLSNPKVAIYLEEDKESGVEGTQNNLPSLEYTNLGYGDYKLHVEIVDDVTGEVTKQAVFSIIKKPRLFELLIVKILIALLAAMLVAFIVWRIMKGTIIRRQYEQIKLAKEEAERANSAKSRFLANISHEIRTPINTIMGMDEMILRENPREVPKGYYLSIVNYAMDIKNASESLLGLVNDVLDLSKIESGKMHLVEQEYDIENLLRSSVSMIRVRSEQKDLYFNVDISPDIPRKLYGDNGKIKQIILNLLTNAVKYTEEGGFSLKAGIVEKYDDSCKIRFSVKDTGIGVKKEDIDKLFTAFERLDEERNSAIQGTGLGLDISRQFANLMNGELTCDSVYGEGSEFVFTVPQKIVDDTPIGEFIEHDEKLTAGPYVPEFIAPDAKILLVDDNPMNLTVIKGLLSATKVDITTAMSGEECLEKLKEQSFHLVLLDHMMPGMDGIETLVEIRKDYADLPVIALTANAAKGSNYYSSKGFNSYLPKPVDGKQLEKEIRKYLPDDIVGEADESYTAASSDEIPEDKMWLYEVDGISVEEGIKNSGGVDPYLFSLDLFLDTIKENAEVIENTLKEDDIRLYTVKVHALKTSARIIGAEELSKLSLDLENAGNKNDREFIEANTSKLLEMYRSYEEKLSALHKKEEESNTPSEEIPREELDEAYAALKDLVSTMDYDGVEMVLEQVREYRLSPEDDEFIKNVEKALKKYDWDKLEELMSH